MLGEKQVNGGQVMTNVSLGQDMSHLFDPVLLLGHVPVKLPELSRFFKACSAFNGQVDKLFVSSLKSRDSFDNDGRVARIIAWHNLILQEALAVLDHLLDAFSKDVDVGFDKRMFLEQVLDTDQMFAIVVGQEAHLELFHGVQNVNHFLEVVLQLQRQFQPCSSGLEQFQEVVPEPQDVVASRVDAVDVVILFCLQL